MTIDETIEALRVGEKIRRPDWPEGDYVEAEGTGNDRKVSQNTMEYHSNGKATLWIMIPSYNDDFRSDDFVLLT